MRSWLAPALVAFVAIASLGSAALAQTAAPPDAAKAEARERFDRGLALFEKSKNAAALAEFKRAYELIPNAVVLNNKNQNNTTNKKRPASTPSTWTVAG